MLKHLGWGRRKGPAEEKKNENEAFLQQWRSKCREDSGLASRGRFLRGGHEDPSFIDMNLEMAKRKVKNHPGQLASWRTALSWLASSG